MNEAEWLQRQGELLTQKQYKILVIKMLLLSIIPCIIFLTGLAVAMIAQDMSNNGEIFGWCGIISMFVSAVFLVVVGVWVLYECAPKCKLYRHYKRHPEDFETEDKVETEKPEEK